MLSSRLDFLGTLQNSPTFGQSDIASDPADSFIHLKLKYYQAHFMLMIDFFIFDRKKTEQIRNLLPTNLQEQEIKSFGNIPSLVDWINFHPNR